MILYLICIFGLPLDLGSLATLMSSPAVKNVVTEFTKNPDTLIKLLPLIESLLNELLVLLNSNNGQLPAGTIPNSLIAPTDSTASPTSPNTPDAVVPPTSPPPTTSSLPVTSTPPSTTSTSPTTSAVPAGIPAQYATYWNKIPANLQAKLSSAISSGKLSMKDIQSLVASKDYTKAFTLLTSAGFTLSDALQLKNTFGQ